MAVSREGGKRWRVAYQIDSHCPLVDSEADFSDKLMEVSHQTGHDPGEAGVSLGPVAAMTCSVKVVDCGMVCACQKTKVTR